MFQSCYPERLRTFHNYPSTAAKSALRLAEVGLVYDGDGTVDVVKCVSCDFRRGHWKLNEDVLQAHKSASPSCLFLAAILENHSLEETTFVSRIGSDRPANIRYASKNVRRKSFVNWTWPYPINTDKMAFALLYATGIGDLTRCFYCGAGIDKWEADDDPWVEQVRLFPCKYVKDHISKDLYDAVMVLKKTNPGKISRNMVKTQKHLAKSLISQNRGERTIKLEIAMLREEQAVVSRRLHCRMCHVSLVGAGAVVFQPCGHFIVCSNCDDGDVCAECGQQIESRLPACLVDVQTSTGV